MSLSTAQLDATRSELEQNLERSGLDAATVAERASLTTAQAQRALGVAGAPPADVWAVRDVLVGAIRAADGEPVPFTALTDEARGLAEGWFPLRRIPTC